MPNDIEQAEAKQQLLEQLHIVENEPELREGEIMKKKMNPRMRQSSSHLSLEVSQRVLPPVPKPALMPHSPSMKQELVAMTPLEDEVLSEHDKLPSNIASCASSAVENVRKHLKQTKLATIEIASDPFTDRSAIWYKDGQELNTNVAISTTAPATSPCNRKKRVSVIRKKPVAAIHLVSETERLQKSLKEKKQSKLKNQLASAQ